MSGKGKEDDETLRAAVKRRVAKEERAFRMVEKMVLDDTVDKQFFLNAGQFITVSQYKDVIEERGITKVCGYPLCNNQLTQILKQKYKISMKEHKVYDITERKNFCSNVCYKASKYYESQISAEPVWMRDDEKSSVELKLFNEEQDLKQRVSGSGEEIVVGRNFSQYSSCDKTQDGSELSFQDTGEGTASGEGMNVDKQEKDCVDNDEVDHDGVGDHNYSDDHDLGDNDTNDDNDDDVKNRSLSKRQSCSAQRTYPVQSTSGNPGNSSPRQGRTAEKRLCQKPEVLNIDSKSEVSDATMHHRSGDRPISTWKEREGCVPRGTEEDKKQKGELKQTVNLKQNDGDEMMETSQESNVVSEKDPNARLGIGNSCAGSENISRVGSRSLEDSSRVGSENISRVGSRRLEDSSRVGLKDSSRVGSEDSSRVGSRSLEDSSRVDNEEASKRKKSVEVVYQTLCEWCRTETWAYFAKCSRSEAGTEERKDFAFSRARDTNQGVAECDSDDDSVDDVNEGAMKEVFVTSGKTRVVIPESAIKKTIKKKPIIPSIDSKNVMSIRGKIVSQKLTKALVPTLSRLGLAFADVSYDITNILKTLRFTSTNIVLKPFQWTLVGLTILLTLMRCNTALRALLCARQKQLHSLLNEAAINEDDLDRLLDVLIPKEDFDQRGFNMEQLD